MVVECSRRIPASCSKAFCSKGFFSRYGNMAALFSTVVETNHFRYFSAAVAALVGRKTSHNSRNKKQDLVRA
jgi:hypothetical protein